MRQHHDPTFSYAGLSKILKRSITTLRSDRVRRPESLPPACEIPGSARPVWIYADVMEWLRSHRADKTAGSRVATNAVSARSTDASQTKRNK
jgi:hypothetical protein